MYDLNSIGIYKVGDLTVKRNYENLRAILQGEWEQILFYDFTIKNKELKRHTKDVKLNQWQNSSYWEKLKNQKRSRQKKAL